MTQIPACNAFEKIYSGMFISVLLKNPADWAWTENPPKEIIPAIVMTAVLDEIAERALQPLVISIIPVKTPFIKPFSPNKPKMFILFMITPKSIIKPPTASMVSMAL